MEIQTQSRKYMHEQTALDVLLSALSTVLYQLIFVFLTRGRNQRANRSVFPWVQGVIEARGLISDQGVLLFSVKL